MKKMYNIGTVVELNSADKSFLVPFIIIGRMIQNKDGQVYDYIVVPFPYGFTSDKSFIGISEDRIVNVLFEGYEDDSAKKVREAYLEKVNGGA